MSVKNIEVISMDVRAQLRRLIIEKPKARYLATPIISCHIECGKVYTILGEAVRTGKIDITAIETDLENQVKSQYLDQLPSDVGDVKHDIVGLSNGVRVNVLHKKPEETDYTQVLSYDFVQPMDLGDIANLIVDGVKKIGYDKFADWINRLTTGDVDKIFELSAMGFKDFILEGGVSPRRLVAQISQEAGLGAVDRSEYINALKSGVIPESGSPEDSTWVKRIEAKKDKWASKFKLITAVAEDFAVKTAIAILQRL